MAKDAVDRYAHRDALDAWSVALELLPDGDEREAEIRLGRARAALASRTDPDTVVDDVRTAARLVAGADGADAAADVVSDLVIDAWNVGDRLTVWRLADVGVGHLDPTRRDRTWARLRRAQLEQAEYEDPEHGGLPLDGDERRELQAVMESLDPGELDGLLFTPSSRAAIEAFLAKDPPRAAAAMARWAAVDLAVLATEVEVTVVEAESEGNFEFVVLGGALHARCLTLLGRHDEADAALARGLTFVDRIPERSNAAFQALAAHWLVSFVRGDRADRTELDLLAEIAQSPDTRWASLAVVAANGLAAARAGDQELALAEIGQTVVGIELAPGYAPNYVFIACVAVHSLWVLDRTDHLETIEANLRAKVIEPDIRYPEVVPELALAQACALTGRADEARDWVTKAHAVVQEQTTLPLDVHIHHFEAEWERRLGSDGDPERFRAALDRARAGCADPAMSPWLTRLDALEAQAEDTWAQ